MLPVEQDSPSGDDVPVTQGLREDAVVTPEAELPMPGRKRKHAEDTSSYENAAATAKAIVDADLQLSVIRALSPVVRFSLPSDCVAFLEVGHLYRRVPILEEYGARVFKYPGDQNVLAQRLAVFNAQHPLDSDAANKQIPGVTITDDAILDLVQSAIRECRPNRYNHPQRTTGLPASLKTTMLGAKKGACTSEDAAAEFGTVRLGMPVKDPSRPTAPASERKPALYEVLITDDLRGHFSELRSAVDSGSRIGCSNARITQFSAAAAAANDMVQSHNKTRGGSHGHGISWTVGMKSPKEQRKKDSDPTKKQYNYTSPFTIRKRLLLRFVDLYKARMGTVKNKEMRRFAPDRHSAYAMFPEEMYCSVIAEATGVPYLLLSCWRCLLSGVSDEAMLHCVNGTIALSDYYNHVSLWNRIAGINPTPKQLLEFEMPQDVKEPKYKVIPPRIGDGYGRTVDDRRSFEEREQSEEWRLQQNPEFY